MKPLPALDTLEDQEVRAAGGELDIGGAHDRPAIQVWRELHMVHFGERRDFLRLQDPADAPQVHLQDGRGPCGQHPREIVLGGEALAGGDRDAGGARHARHFLGRIRRHRFLEPQRIVGLEAPREANRARGGHLPVRAEQQVGIGAHGGAQLAHEALAQIERRERQLPAVEGRVGSGRIKLQGGEALREVLDRALGGEIRILVHVAPVPGTRVDIGVGAQPLVYPPPEQVVDGLVRFLADDVPAGHLERTQHRHQRQVRMLRIACRVHAPPDPLDVVRVLAREVALEDVGEHARHHLGVKRHAVGFAHPVNVAVGGELHEHEVAPAVARGGVPGDESPDVSQSHRAML